MNEHSLLRHVIVTKSQCSLCCLISALVDHDGHSLASHLTGILSTNLRIAALLLHRTSRRHIGHLIRLIEQFVQHSVVQHSLSTASFNVSKQTTHVNSSLNILFSLSSGRSVATSSLFRASTNLFIVSASLFSTSAHLFLASESLFARTALCWYSRRRSRSRGTVG